MKAGDVVEVSGMRHKPHKVGWRVRILSHFENGYAWCFNRKGEVDDENKFISAWTYCRPIDPTEITEEN